MTATGWYTLLTPGSRSGSFNPDFTDASGNPLGDPYGSLAVLAVVVPNAISNDSTLPAVDVLVEGLLLDSYDSSGAYVTSSFSNNSAWVLLDILLRSGWNRDQYQSSASFAARGYICRGFIVQRI